MALAGHPVEDRHGLLDHQGQAARQGLLVDLRDHLGEALQGRGLWADLHQGDHHVPLLEAPRDRDHMDDPPVHLEGEHPDRGHMAGRRPLLDRPLLSPL